MRRAIFLVMLFVLCACTAQIKDKTSYYDATIPNSGMLVVAASSWTDPIASLATIVVENNFEATKAVATTNASDVILRSFFAKIFVINRWGSDSIQVINPDDFSVVADYTVGEGSNPQDIWLVSEGKAYVTRLDSQNDVENQDDILIINPLNGSIIGSIDLKPYTTDDGERLARATQMVAVDDKLFVCMQDLPLNLLNSADTNGKIAVIDTSSDEVIKVIELSGRNPSDITYSALSNLIYVTDQGVFNNFTTDVSDDFGGIEVIDFYNLETKGIKIDDADLSAFPSEVRLVSDTKGFVIVGGNMIAEFNPTTFEVTKSDFYVTSGFYLPDFSVDEDGYLYIADRAESASGIMVVDSINGSTVTGPISVGAEPASLTFIDME